MKSMRLAVWLLAPLGLWAQAGPAPAAASPCDNTPAYSSCDLVFELPPGDAAAHPNPYVDVNLRIEFRSPRMRTYALGGFWAGSGRMVVRFSPVEAGRWDYRVTSNVAAWNGREGSLTAAASGAPGFIRPVSLHHWVYTEGMKAHLWMGVSEMRFASLEDADFRALADARAAQKFNHLRGYVLTEGAGFRSATEPDQEYFRRLDERIRYLNQKGITADLVLAPSPAVITKLFPEGEQRRRFARYLAARYSGMNVTWQGVEAFEADFDGRAVLADIAAALRDGDPYQHPRTSAARVTSAPLLRDGWMDFVADGPDADDSVASIEHQIYGVPFVKTDMGREDSGAGKPGGQGLDAAQFRSRLWNAVMNGQYPTYANTGEGAKFANSPGAKAMTAWFDLFSSVRHWEMEPFFDVSGGRAVALEDSDYIVYVEKPGPVEMVVEKHNYEVYWIDPATGQATKAKKDFNGNRFTGEPPDKSHDWVLRLIRPGRLESLARSYKFESRESEEESRALPIGLQEVESNPTRVPFEIELPAGDISVSAPTPYGAKVMRQTRATSTMTWLWTADVNAEGQGFRVLATGQNGSIEPPAGLARNLPAIAVVRVYGMNAVGKVYELTKACQIVK